MFVFILIGANTTLNESLFMDNQVGTNAYDVVVKGGGGHINCSRSGVLGDDISLTQNQRCSIHIISTTFHGNQLSNPADNPFADSSTSQYVGSGLYLTSHGKWRFIWIDKSSFINNQIRAAVAQWIVGKEKSFFFFFLFVFRFFMTLDDGCCKVVV
jgi:hypothetical protein